MVWRVSIACTASGGTATYRSRGQHELDSDHHLETKGHHVNTNRLSQTGGVGWGGQTTSN